MSLSQKLQGKTQGTNESLAIMAKGQASSLQETNESSLRSLGI